MYARSIKGRVLDPEITLTSSAWSPQKLSPRMQTARCPRSFPLPLWKTHYPCSIELRIKLSPPKVKPFAQDII